MSGGSNLPRWNLASIYPSFDSPEYAGDLKLLREQIDTLLYLLENPLPEESAGARLVSLIRAWEAAGDTAENLENYAEAIYSVSTQDSRALEEINAVDAAALPLGKAAVLLRGRLAGQRELVLRLAETAPELADYRFFIKESLKKAAFQMSPELEDLANDLARSGGDAWSRLHGAISSTASAPWDDGERKTVTALRDLAFNPDRSVRERAYRAELEVWKSMELPLAAALNGVKGTAITLDRRRGWHKAGAVPAGDAVPASVTALRKSCFQSRMEEKTLAVLIETMESALPLYRRYLKAKAALVGVPVCAFYDIFAPVGGNTRSWTWEESSAFILERFGAFDPEMETFARRTFASSWIDAEGREGKVGGAYCTGFPLKGESRILCNFEGSFDSVTTVAHELGHGWHHELIKDLPRSRSAYPMTLAETASIFAETIVFEGALAGDRSGPAERLGLIEENLKDSCQVIVDILSRYYFEKELFKRRDRAELSPADLSAMMTCAQQKTYGDALDPKQLHPYMWAVKPHYYGTGLAFYNYPYAFGALFSQGLYARYQEEGPGFAAAYRNILRLTGEASVEEIARQAGFDIQGENFWRDGLSMTEKRVAEFEKLAGGGI
jgi:pepF/M3 family oligoendopeptidase